MKWYFCGEIPPKHETPSDVILSTQDTTDLPAFPCLTCCNHLVKHLTTSTATWCGAASGMPPVVFSQPQPALLASIYTHAVNSNGSLIAREQQIGLTWSAICFRLFVSPLIDYEICDFVYIISSLCSWCFCDFANNYFNTNCYLFLLILYKKRRHL